MSNVDPNKLPIATHERMLGVDITIHAQLIWSRMHGKRHPGGLDTEIEIRRWGVEHTPGPGGRYELAYWARRNLFNGEPTES